MASSNSFRVRIEADDVAEERLREWAASKFVQAHSTRNEAGHLILVCAHKEAKTAKSFKLMLRNFEQHSGTCIGKMFELHLLDECATSSEVVELEAPDPEPAPQNKVEILASLPPDFDRKAQEKYEKLFAIRAC